MSTTVATLPEAARASFKEPLGPLFQDVTPLLESAGAPLVTVGDVVTARLVQAGVTPHVAVVDGITEREPVSDEVAASVPDADRTVTVENPPGVLTAALLEALDDALAATESTLVRVDGEEDLATLPAILMAPRGASVVYGQPGEGMVRVDVTPDRRERVRERCGALETTAGFWERVGVESPA